MRQSHLDPTRVQTGFLSLSWRMRDPVKQECFATCKRHELMIWRNFVDAVDGKHNQIIERLPPAKKVGLPGRRKHFRYSSPSLLRIRDRENRPWEDRGGWI